MANNIKDRIEKIKEYFKGMRVDTDNGENAIYIIVQFPPKWIVDNTIEEKYGINVIQGNEYPGQFYFCAEMEVGFDVLFDAIEYSIDKMLTAQERARLLKEKAEELKELFIDETIPIEALRTLTFTYKTAKPKKVSKTKKEEIKTQENDIEE